MRDRFASFTGFVITLNRYLQRIKDIEMQQFGLRAQHTMCLYYLGQHEEGLTATQLTTLCREDKAAVSRCLRQLSEKGLIHSEQSGDRRAYRTVQQLTDTGKALAAQINERVEAALWSGGKGLTEQQRQTFYEALEIITHNLEDYLGHCAKAPQ